jgi:membrane dipeptidase
MRACANRGGVIGLTGVGRFLGPGPDLVASLTCQVAHVADLVGPSHVGLSLDYVFDLDELKQLVESNPAVFAPGADAADRAALGPEAIPEIADGLVRLKFTDSEIRGILGGNWLRVAQEVWK